MLVRNFNIMYKTVSCRPMHRGVVADIHLLFHSTDLLHTHIIMFTHECMLLVFRHIVCWLHIKFDLGKM